MILVSATSHFPELARAFMNQAAEATHSEEEWRAMRLLHLRGDAQIQALFDQPRAFAQSEDDLCFSAQDSSQISARAARCR